MNTDRLAHIPAYMVVMMKWMNGTKNQKLQPYLLGRKTGMKQYLEFFNGIFNCKFIFCSTNNKKFTM
jgi:hypothetical protein